jgi:chemotaxis response regulator CheB
MSDLPDGTPAAHPERHRAPLVVGLGASAGGIPALKQFFAHVSPGSGAAYVVILHLSPDHESHLAEVLQVTAPIPVTQVSERVRVQPDHVYVVSPNKSLSVIDNHLLVADITRAEQRRAPVDLFFRTLADAHGSRSAAVVLSGTGPDGSSGLKRVKEYGGLTIAQEPLDAQHGDMPRNAIATGFVDFVLPVAEIPARLAEYSARLQREGEAGESVDAVKAIEDPEAMGLVLALLRIRTGHDFSN